MSSLLLLANQLKEVAVAYTVGLVTLIIIGVSLVNILYRILKWIIRVEQKMTILGEVIKTFKQLQKEKAEGLSEDKIDP